MKINKSLITMLEMQAERGELSALGLLEDEIDGYFDYYIDNYLADLKMEKE